MQSSSTSNCSYSYVNKFAKARITKRLLVNTMYTRADDLFIEPLNSPNWQALHACITDVVS